MAIEKSLPDVFEEQRNRLHALAFRMLGSHSDADDALQDTWLRAERAGLDGVDNPAAWLTTITTRVCLNQLRSRNVRNEDGEALDVVADDSGDPAHESVLAEAVGLAMLVVLDALTPAERVAFVLHDMFSMPFDDIAEIVGKTSDATRQLASRARRRVQDVDIRPGAGDTAKRDLVDAFFLAARAGDLSALMQVLHPDVVLQANTGRPTAFAVTGAEKVAGRATMFANPVAVLRPVDVEGEPGVLVAVDGVVISLMVFTVRDDVVVAIDSITEPDQLTALAP